MKITSDMDATTKRFRILSIDGGGVRGLIPAIVLAELEKKLQDEAEDSDRRLFEEFDLICGTSTGAILALAIALGVSAKDLVRFYKENAHHIFPKWYLKVLPVKFRVLVTTIYSNKKLRNKVRSILKEANGGKDPLMNDLKTRVCVPSFNGAMGEINVFKTKHCREYLRDFKLPVFEVAISSASAPVYFPPHTFSFKNDLGEGHNESMIDGGIFANNPTLIGILEATEKLNVDIDNIDALSLGTGRGKHIVKKKWNSGNFFYWFVPNPRLLDIVLDSQAQITEQYVLFLERIWKKKGSRFKYLRVQHDFSDSPIALNASGKDEIRKLEIIGQELSKNNLNSVFEFLNF